MLWVRMSLSANLGNKIKILRLENDLTQEELADRCELTKGFISQLERDLTSPSISTLSNILEVLGTDLSDFFSNTIEEKVVFRNDEFFEKYNEELKHKIKWIVPNAQKYEMEPIIIEIDPGGLSYQDEPHVGEEFGYILEGEVILNIGKKKYYLKQGNTFYYIANKYHSLKNSSSSKAVVLWVSTPPMF